MRTKAIAGRLVETSDDTNGLALRLSGKHPKLKSFATANPMVRFTVVHRSANQILCGVAPLRQGDHGVELGLRSEYRVAWQPGMKDVFLYPT